MKKEIPWDLIVSKLKNEISADDNRLLSDWVAANGELFEELCILWEKIRVNASCYQPDKEYYWKELSRRIHATGEVGGKHPARPVERNSAPLRLVPRRVYYAVAACAVILLAVAFFAGQWSGVSEPVSLEYVCMSGKASATLPDCSSVWLHNDTRVVCDVSRKGGSERVVTLQGEAYFDVAHDEGRPFLVKTGGMIIRVHGTKFNVEAFPDADSTCVSLLEGSVSLETATEQRFLQPGETATYNKLDGKLSVVRGDVLLASSWTQDQVVFSQRSLRDICRVLGKWYNVKIDLAPSVADKYRYTFTLRDESLEEILRLMSRINPIGYTFTDENELIIYDNEKTNPKM